MPTRPRNLAPLLALLALAPAPDARACAAHGTAADAAHWASFKKTYRKPKAPERSVAATSTKPPLLPNTWGGSNSARWRAEAITANAFSAALNEGWAEPGIKDVLVAIPGKFHDSSFHPYGDGQSNSRLSFESWSQPRPPLTATLLKFESAPSRVLIRFDRAMNLAQTGIEIAYQKDGRLVTVTIPARKDSSGDLVGTWGPIAPELGWDKPAHTALALVRPTPNYQDWFPLNFRHPVKPIPELLGTVPESMRHFSDGKTIVDAEGVAQKAGDSISPFEKLLHHAFPSRYNPTPYIPANIHGEFGSGGPVTGVGRGWTWVAERDAPFKIMYTCFERRQPEAEASARDGGVASGGGWHSIGDNAETILNSLEASPVAVVSGFASPGKRVGLSPPPGSAYSYGLNDIAVARWLWPGEAFLTTKGATEPNFHWYFFQQSREVCTEEWVHPCLPKGDDPDFRCQ